MQCWSNPNGLIQSLYWHPVNTNICIILCNNGPTSKTLGRRCINVIGAYKCLVLTGQENFLSNIAHLSNARSMVSQRRRSWPNIKTALDQCLVWVVSCNRLSGYINAVNLYSIGYCWPTLDHPMHSHFAVEWFFNFMIAATNNWRGKWNRHAVAPSDNFFTHVPFLWENAKK